MKMNREFIKTCLNQYRLAVERKRIIERRYDMLLNELRHPGIGSSIKSMPPVDGGKQGDGAMAVIFRADEIRQRYESEIEIMQNTLIGVMDLIALLPPNSVERSILELRHIDGRRWDFVAATVHLSRSRAHDYYDNALDFLAASSAARVICKNILLSNKNSDTIG